MISRSSLAHIRIPFSYFLMPVFFLALFCAGSLDPAKTLIVFFVLHFLLYPASNGWLYIGVCQGLLTFLLVLFCVGDARAKDILSFRILFPSIACCLFILGFYPLTQVYQHREDAKRHDFTISMLWGVQGTFYCTAPLLLASGTAFFLFFTLLFGIRIALFFLLMLIPAGAYFVAWFIAVARDASKTDFNHAMRMNIVASSGVNVFAVVSLFLIKIG